MATKKTKKALTPSTVEKYIVFAVALMLVVSLGILFKREFFTTKSPLLPPDNMKAFSSDHSEGDEQGEQNDPSEWPE
jgi:hypothetical protein